MKPVSAWGRLSNDLHNVQVLNDRTQVAPVLATHQPGLAYGNGRSYGDVCLNPNWQFVAHHGAEQTHCI